MTPIRAAIYCRISRDDPDDNDERLRVARPAKDRRKLAKERGRLGVARQEKDCRKLAKERGWKIAGVYIDNDISAYSGKRRPEYLRLMEDIEGGIIDGLIAWHPDRLHRPRRTDLEDFITLVESVHIPIITVKAGEYDLSTANGRQNARIVGAVSRGESEHMAERIRRKHLELAEAGKSHGGGARAFGYEPYDKAAHRPGGIRAPEARVIKDAVRRVLAGESLYALVNEWNTSGVKTAGGKFWDITGLRQVLTSARISGRREHHGEIIDNVKADWPGIITTRESDALRRRLAPDRGRRATERSRFLLTPLVYCGLCGERLSAARLMDRQKQPAGGGYACAFHIRARPNACGKLRVRSTFLDVHVTEELFKRLDTPQLARVVQGRKRGAKQQHAALDDVGELEEDLTTLAKEFGAGRIRRAEWLEARKPLEARLQKAQQRLGSETGTAAIDGFVGKSGVLRKAWGPLAPLGQLAAKRREQLTPVNLEAYERSLSLDRKRAILALVVDRVVVNPADPRKPRNLFDPGRVRIEWKV